MDGNSVLSEKSCFSLPMLFLAILPLLNWHINKSLNYIAQSLGVKPSKKSGNLLLMNGIVVQML
jgi:hypothetical protein